MSLSIESNRLVARVKTGHITLPAVYTQIVVDDWELLLLRHVIDVFEVVAARSSHVFKGWHLLYVY